MLDISPVLLLSTAIIFLLVVARLDTSLFKPLLKHMDERTKSIENDLEDAKSNSADVDGMKAQANDILAKAKKKASSIREQAYIEAKTLANEKLAKAKENLQMQNEEFLKTLENDKGILKDTLVASMPKFTKSLKAKLNSI